MFITQADPATIANLWQRVRSMFVRASSVIGAPEKLAALTALTRPRRREIAGWLALLEAIVRKLIFAEAAELRRAELQAAARLPRLEIITLAAPGSSGSVRSRAAAVSPLAAPQALVDPSQPQTWRVRFKLAPPRDPHACPASRAPRIRALWGPTPPPPPPAPPRAPRQVAPAPLRLALRLEALRRAIADPAPYARRLARVLPRLCRRYSLAAERYSTATARPHWADRGDARLIVEAMAVALWVAPIFANSS